MINATPAEITISTRRGPVVVPVDRIASAKRVPPGPEEITALERTAAGGWPAPDREALGAWLLRAAGGWTARANSALALGDPGRPLPEAIEATRAWYAARDLPARITTPLPVASPVAAALRSLGWSAAPPVLVQTADLATIPPTVADPGIRLTTELSDATVALLSGREGALPAPARTLLTTGEQVRFVEAYRSQTLVATARATVNDGWLGIWMVEVAGPGRQQGLVGQIMSVLAGWGGTAGAGRAYLQVEQADEAGLALYTGLGFTTHHTYRVFQEA